MAGISARSPNVNDLEAIDRAIEAAIAETERPSLVVVHSHIGYGSPVQDTAKAHGSPLGDGRRRQDPRGAGLAAPAVQRARRGLCRLARPGAASAPRRMPPGRRQLERYRGDEPERAAEFERVMAGRLPDGWRDALPTFQPGTRVATRVSGGQA